MLGKFPTFVSSEGLHTLVNHEPQQAGNPSENMVLGTSAAITFDQPRSQGLYQYFGAAPFISTWPLHHCHVKASLWMLQVNY